MRKTIFALLSIACGLFVYGLAGGSDAGMVTVGQVALYGTLGLAGTIIFGRLAGKEMGR